MRKEKLDFTKEDAETLEGFRDAVHKITADREPFMNLIEAAEKGDVKRYQEILKRYEVRPIVCKVICYWLCWIRWYIQCVRVCKLLCPWPITRE